MKPNKTKVFVKVVPYTNEGGLMIHILVNKPDDSPHYSVFEIEIETKDLLSLPQNPGRYSMASFFWLMDKLGVRQIK